MLFEILKRVYHFFGNLLSTPFILMTKITKYIYIAELVSIIPFRIGELIRYYFYKNTLSSFGENVVISFGTIISYADATVGNHVWIGTYNTFGHVDIGDYSQISQRCNFLSGSRQYVYENINTPIKYQPGFPKRIKIGPDIWVGANSTIMYNIGKGCVIGAGSVITKDIPDYSIAAGNPARIIKSRI